MGDGPAGAPAGEYPPVFVVSTGRCGSTLLSRMLRLHPEILSLSEFFGLLLSGPFPPGELTGAGYWQLLSTPHPFVTTAYRAGAPIGEFLYRPVPGGRFTAATGIPPILVTPLPHLSEEPESLYDEVARFARQRSPAPAAVQHQRLFRWLRQRAGARVWVERSGFSLRHLPELIALFPGARFVHLYRDGRECAYSMSQSGAFRLGTMWLRLTEALGVNPYLDDIPDSVTVPPELTPFLPGSFDLRAFQAIDLPVEDFGRVWAQEVLAGLDTLGHVPAGRLLQISYETLTADPAGTLTRLARFIGPVSASPDWLERAGGLVSQRPPRWLGLPAAERDRLTRICEPAMSRLYPQPAAPAVLSGQ